MDIEEIIKKIVLGIMFWAAFSYTVTMVLHGSKGKMCQQMIFGVVFIATAALIPVIAVLTLPKTCVDLWLHYLERSSKKDIKLL